MTLLSFWKTEADDEKKAAYSTLYKCLRTVIHLMAPIIPFTTEALYQRMVRTVEPDARLSIHHNEWPEVDQTLLEEELMAEMDLAMNVSSLGRAARNKSNIKLRQPLKEALVVVDSEQLPRLNRVTELIQEELNVKTIITSTDRSLLQDIVVNPLPSRLGRKYGQKYPLVQKAIKNLSSVEASALNTGETVNVVVEDEKIEVLPDEVEIQSVPKEDYSVIDDIGVLVGVYTVITEDLESEGLARDIVRRIQALRKEADFEINDHIVTYYDGDPEVLEVFKDESEYIKVETLSDELIQGKAPASAKISQYEIDGVNLTLGLIKN